MEFPSSNRGPRGPDYRGVIVKMPKLMLTKITKVRCMPGARSSDWNTALNALPLAAADCIQIRSRQAATVSPTPGDILRVAHGGGAHAPTSSDK